MFTLVLSLVCGLILCAALGLVIALAANEGRCQHATRCRCDFGPGR